MFLILNSILFINLFIAMLEKSLLIFLTLWVIFWTLIWLYDQTRMGKRDIKNILFAFAGSLALAGYFFLR